MTETYVSRALELIAGYGDAEAVVSGERRTSHAELRQRVLDLAAALPDRGVPPGSALGVLTGNDVDAVVSHLAAHLLGCRTAYVAADSPPWYQMDFLRLAEVDAFLYDPAVATLLPAVPLIPLDAPLPAGAKAIPTPGGEPQSILETGGTTARPKLVHYREPFYRSILALSAGYLAAGLPPLRHVTMSFFSHISGHVAALMTLLTGGVWLPQPDFVVDDLLRVIERERVTSIFLTPAQLYQVLDHPRLASTDTSSLHTVSVGAGPTAPARLAQAVEVFGPVVRVTYGSTEAAFIAALPGIGADPSTVDRLHSCGRPYGDMRVRIRDERGAVLPPGDTGEVWVSGGLTMAGYWGEPELTAQTIVDGWLRTGDLGYLDAEGYLFLVDRAKDLIITGIRASKIYSRPVEDVLAAHPQVRAAAVIGVPDPAHGEVVHAYVVPVPGAEVTAAELRQRVVDAFDETWAPRRVEFLDALPLTDVGKVDKKALRAHYHRMGH